jgi:hypothetical protein
MIDNIVSFPKEKIVREGDQNNEELLKVKTKSVQNFADTLTNDIAETIFEGLNISGISVDDESFGKDFHFLVCVLNAVISRTLKLEHPFHKFIDDNVVFTEMDENDLDTSS